jgi:hypothetical protein
MCLDLRRPLATRLALCSSARSVRPKC